MATFVCHDGRRIRSVTSAPPTTSLNVIRVEEDIAAETIFSQYEVRQGLLVAKEKPKDGLRVAMVSVYSIRCGISTYSEWLWAAMSEQVADYRIFAEMEGAEGDDDEHVVRCWDRGKPLSCLAEKIKEYDPDVVFIQHEYGTFPVARYWLSLMSSLSDYRVITTLHSVYSHKDKTVIEAACPEIIVHTEAAQDILVNQKQVPGKVYVIPHGCDPYADKSPLWNIYHSEHTLIQFGFGFPYKGWENSLQVTKELLGTYPDVFFTGLFSEAYKHTHDVLHSTLQKQIDALGIRDNTALIRGFQSDPSLDAYLRTNRVALFPYVDNGDHTVFGCSGAARVAMSRGLPVVATDVPLFYDLKGVAKVVQVSELYDTIAELFGSPEARAEQLARQAAFLEENSWEKSAARYLDIVQ